MIEKNPGGTSGGSGLPVYNPNDPIHQKDSLDTAPKPKPAPPARSSGSSRSASPKPAPKPAPPARASSGASRASTPRPGAAPAASGGNGSLLQILEQAGFRGQALKTAYAIAMAESGGNASAFNGNAGTGDLSYGLFQINMLGAMGPDRLKRFGLKSNEDLLDPATNARVAFLMSNGGKNWQPWSTFKTGAYKQYLNGPQTADITNTSDSSGGVSPSGATQNPAVKLSPEELAQNYGWAQAVLTSDPELKSLFQQAVAGQWTADRFTAALDNTKWFQTHSSAWRTAEAERLSDPASWSNRVSQAQAQIQQTAAQLGAQLNDAQLKQITDNYLHGGWSQSFLQKTLTQYITVQKNGSFGGQAGDMESQLRQYAYDNGVRVADSWISNGVKGVLAGTTDMNTLQNNLRSYALSAFPTLADQIKAGQSVKDIASPYIQTMGQLLELDPNKIDLFDPTIRSALSTTGQDGKPTTKSLWQFENDLRNDPRWMQTNNARESMSGVASKILSDWGLISG